MSVFNDVGRPDSGMVTITGEEGAAITLLLTGDPDYQAAVGGWETTDRVGQQAGTWWRGQGLAAMSLATALHVNATGSDIERQIRLLEALGQPSGATGDPPPPVQVLGDVPSSPATLWAIQSIKHGTRLYQPDAPTQLLVADLAIELIELGRTGVVSQASPTKTRVGKKQKRRTRVIKAKKGDTIRAIAVRELGNSADWLLVRSWNKKLKRTDPDARLRAGTKVTLR